MPFTGQAWRVFPCDRQAPPGQPFSPTYISPTQGSGRFDITDTGVTYLAETPEHAVAEKIQRFRGQTIEDHDLTEFGRPLALVECQASTEVIRGIADLCDWNTLAKHALGPYVVASRALAKTQAIAKMLYDAGYVGLRWWSALSGDWHSVVLFLARLSADGLRYMKPQILTLDHPAVREAASAIGVGVESP